MTKGIRAIEKKMAEKEKNELFEKTSTRTRCSFEVAAHDLGMGTTYLDPSGSQIGKKERTSQDALSVFNSFRKKAYSSSSPTLMTSLPL